MLELVKSFIDFSFILPPADSEHGLKQLDTISLGRPKFWGKRRVLQRAFTQQQQQQQKEKYFYL